MTTQTTFTSINNDYSGNPRSVFHYTDLSDSYNEALHIAKKLFNCRKFHNRQYGGGIVVSSYNLEKIDKLIIDNKTN